jgi:redox-sensing transcriptional repressor
VDDRSGAAQSGAERPPADAVWSRPEKHVSLQTVERLSVYRKALEELDREGVEYVHSQKLADLVNVTPAQLRRDLASFGTFGNISRGYNVYQMSRTIGRILGTSETQAVALFGVGDLGRALLSYRGFEERGFHIAVAFDVVADKVGRVFAGRRCYHVNELETVLPEFEVRMAVLATRTEGLQALVDRIAGSGVHAILNFVPKLVKAPAGCFVEHTDITAKLELLSFLVRSSGEQPDGQAGPAEVMGGAAV